MWSKIVRLASFGLIIQGLLTLNPVWAAAIAMVTDMKNQASVNGQALTLFAELEADSKITLASGSSLTLVYLQSGKEYVINGPAKLVLGQQGPEKNNTILTASNQLNSSASLGQSTTKYSQAAIIMRAGDKKTNPLRVITPHYTKVLGQQPEFRWQMRGKGYQYRLEIFDAAGHSLYVAETSENHLKLPASVVLPVNQVLNWEIEAIKGMDAYFNSAEFIVADQKTIEQVEKLKPLSSSFSQLAYYARNLERMGFYDEAQKYWKKLAQMRPGDKNILKKIHS